MLVRQRANGVAKRRSVGGVAVASLSARAMTPSLNPLEPLVRRASSLKDGLASDLHPEYLPYLRAFEGRLLLLPWQSLGPGIEWG